MWISVTESFSSPGTRRHRSGRGGRARRALTSRRRRALVAALCRAASATPSRDPLRRRFDLLLHDRVREVRADLLEIAVLLAVDNDPDLECIAELRRLVRDGCDSPLYNSDIHPSELRATLYHVRSRLEPPTAARVDLTVTASVAGSQSRNVSHKVRGVSTMRAPSNAVTLSAQRRPITGAGSGSLTT